jgi:zinc protease
MSRLRTFAVSISLFAFALGAAGQVTDYKDIKTPKLRQFSMPQPKRIALPNGLVIFLQEDHELPLVRGSALIRGGGRDVPAAKTGLIGIYGQSWRTGGTTTHTGDQLDELLEARAAHLETGGGVDSTSVSLDVLKGDLDTVFPLFVDLLRNPAFRQDKIDLAKTQANTGISRRNDEPGGIVGREATRLGYGADSPYARQAEYATIAAITREDLLDFHRRTVHPNNIILSFIGDFDTARMEKRLRDTFGGWARGPQIPRPEASITPAKPGVYFVAKDDVTQANIAMVHAGIERRNPDYHAVQVMNEIFSGGFSGRLMQTLRSQRGLTYGVGGGVGAAWDYPGLFRVQMATKSGTTLESIDALRGEINRLVTAPVTDEELAQAKESILNAFVFTMDSRAEALSQQVLLEFYGFPSDYFTKYPSMIEKVTAADVQRVAQSYVHPDRLSILVVGKEADFEKPLGSLGTVTPIDITIPAPPGSEAPAAPTSGNAEGAALVAKVAEFAGGAANVAAVKSLRRAGSITLVTPQGEMQAEIDALVQYPSSQRVEMKLPMGTMVRVVTPEAAFMTGPMGNQDLPGSQKEASLAELRGDLVTILQNAGNPKYVISAGGSETVGGVAARIVDINADGSMVRWFVDPATGRLLRTITHTTVPMPGEVVTDLSDWKAFGGISLPTASVVSRDGQKSAEIRLTAVEVNPAVAAGTFVKP